MGESNNLNDTGKTNIFSKIFGGIHMTWPKTIISAAAAAVLTALIVILPVFSGTSFENIGVCFEFWVMAALFIVLNCEKPLEAALKTFVFFLISQPLIYLFQVPFYSEGWAIFKFYKYWFIWTLLTIPGGYIAWYVKKQNWLSVIIYGVAEGLLAVEFGASNGHFVELTLGFPHQLIACIFILFEMILFAVLLFKGEKRLVSILAGLLMTAGMLVFTTDLFFTHSTVADFYPSAEGPYTIVSIDDNVEVVSTEDNEIKVRLTEYGEYEIVFEDASGNTWTQHITFDSTMVSYEEEEQNNK